MPADPPSTPKEPPTSIQKSVQEEIQSPWILQASSSPREENAQSLSKRLRSKGYKTEVKPVLIKGKTWFRVYVGPYTTAAAAKEAAAKLSRQEGLTPIARKI
jgi:cell division septation protein DedD